MKNFLLLSICMVLSFTSFSQSEDEPEYIDRVQTIDSTIESLYAVISGPAGQERDWEFFNYLFVEDGKLIPSGKAQDGSRFIMHWSPEDYQNNSGEWLVKNGFFEKEIARKTERFGNIAHVFSTYAAFKTDDDSNPFMRGINSIQLFHDGNRWWIVSVYWTSETPENPLPEEYLQSK